MELTTKNTIKMENKIEPLSPVNPQCLNCLHYWNIGSVIPKNKCTNSEIPNYGKEIKKTDVCDFYTCLL